MDNSEVAALLAETALLMELAGSNPFKIRSFRKAADLISALEEPLATVHAEGRLQKLPGVGKGIGGELAGLLESGKLAVLEELREKVPRGLLEMTRIRGLGPAKVKKIHETLGISTLGELEYACLENRLMTLKGFGQKTQISIMEELTRLRSYAGFFHIDYALKALEAFLEHLEGCPGVIEAVISGDPRRYLEVVREGILVVGSEDRDGVRKACDTFEGMAEVVAQGERSIRCRLRGGLPVEVIVADPDELPFLLLETTGSSAHLEELAARAAQKGVTLGDRKMAATGARKRAAEAEKSIYETLDLAYVPPELREGAGEIEAAARGKLVDLVAAEDLKGILHVHTEWSDGHESIATMAEAARDLGYQFLGITDHSRTAWYANGLSIERLQEQGAEIARLNAEFEGFRILHGVESDILPSGDLDYPQEVLEELDFVIASVHSSFRMDRDTMTARLIKAMEHPATKVLGHPTGRLLLGREGYPLDMQAVLEAAVRLGVMIEINANPYRLDIDWRHLRRCRELEIPILINPDAHRIEGFDDVAYGIGIARKGGLDASAVANTLPVEELLALWR